MRGYPIIKKAYLINRRRLYNPEELSLVWCYATSRNKARQSLLHKIRYDDLETFLGDPITYINIPVIRFRAYDLLDFEGEAKTLDQIDIILRRREHLAAIDKILSDDNVSYCYIRKGGYLYRPGSCGYTEHATSAGVYTKQEAAQHAKGCDELTLIPVDIIAHNNAIRNSISSMESRLIQPAT